MTGGRIGWFREAAFGMFIHWGLYAIPAGFWKGRAQGSGAVSEWIMSTLKIPVREYEQLANEFNPQKFDAKSWVDLAQAAGMKYIIITAKHHDGFAMFHSQVSRYNVVDATPFGRDPIAELAEECSRAGIRLGFYYSQDQDWHEPGGSGNYWDYPKRRKDAVEAIEGSITWPERWRVFAPFATDDGLPPMLEIPEQLTLNGKTVPGTDVTFVDGKFDFDPLLGPEPPRGRRHRIAYAYTTLTVEQETQLTMGAGADWWMQWYLDGKLVYDTYQEGGGAGNEFKPIALTNHVFNLKLTPGKHVLMLRFLSGAGGADVATGGPAELRKANWRPLEGGIDPERGFREYLDEKVKPQLKELLTDYGPVAVIWFDTPISITPEQSKELEDYVHALQPACLVSGRVGHGVGDYECLADNQYPDRVLEGVWEGMFTTNRSWGYKSDDHDWKTGEELIKILRRHEEGNANLLLNVGPDAEGVIPEPAAKALREVGAWK